MIRHIRKHSILDKILICGAGLVMLSSTGAGVVSNTVNAKSIHHNHIHNVYHRKRHHISNRGYHHYNHHIRHQSRYLAYNQLIPAVNYVYKQVIKSNNVDNHKSNYMMALVNNTIRHNAKRYNYQQIQKLLHNYYAFAFSNNATNALNNSLRSKSNTQSIISQPQVNINQRNNHRGIQSNQPANFLPSHQSTQAIKGTLSYNELIPTVEQVYSQVKNGVSFDNSGVDRDMELVNNSIIKSSGNYTQNQLAQLYNSKYYIGFSNQAENAINNNLNKCNQQIASQAWNNRGNNDYAKQIAQYDYDYLNLARKEDGLKPLPINGYAQEIANLRAKQYTHDEEAHDSNQLESDELNGINKPADNLAHGFDYHDSESNDAKAMGIKNDNGMGENAGSINTGFSYSIGDRFGDKTHEENNDTPQEISYNDINDMLNYDRYTGNGHRDNILDKKATGVGVSSYYHSNGVKSGTASGYKSSHGGVIEDFSYGNNPANV